MAPAGLRRRYTWPRIAVSLGVLGFAAATAPLAGASPTPATAGNAISGYWRLAEHGPDPKPALTAWAKGEMKKVATNGDVDLDAVRWCVFQGMPFVMDSAGPIEIRRAPTETVVVAERIAVVRHIYTAMPKHPGEDTFDNTVVGNSIGHWAGGVLTADTTQFKAGVGPAGAPRTDRSHLVEHFRVLPGGKRLAVTSTWTDPKVFAKPYTYTWTYERLPAEYTPEEYYCDARRNGVGHP